MKIYFFIFAFKIKFCSKSYFRYTLKLSIKSFKREKNSKFLGNILSTCQPSVDWEQNPQEFSNFQINETTICFKDLDIVNFSHKWQPVMTEPLQKLVHKLKVVKSDIKTIIMACYQGSVYVSGSQLFVIGKLSTSQKIKIQFGDP